MISIDRLYSLSDAFALVIGRLVPEVSVILLPVIVSYLKEQTKQSFFTSLREKAME